jgi:hypothetical protein
MAMNSLVAVLRCVGIFVVLTALTSGCRVASENVGALQLCTGQSCKSAGENHSGADILHGLFDLLKASEGVTVKPCESDEAKRQCLDDGFNLFVMAGPLPAYAHLKSMTFKDIRLSGDGREIALTVAISGTFLGAPAVCGDFVATIRTNPQNNPVLKGKESFYCNWLVVGNIFWDYEHTFDYIDFSKGIIGGHFAFSALGLLTGGGATGYGLHNLRPLEVAANTALTKAPPIAVAAEQIKTVTRDSETSRHVTDELRLWESVKISIHYEDFQRYLERYPEGLFAELAKTRIRNLAALDARGEDRSGQERLADIAFGAYHALIIGIDDYKHLPKLETAVSDAEAVAKVLEEDYGFKVTKLINADRFDIINALDEYRETLGVKDNLLIYYAGHGWMDQEMNRGYWLPVGVEPKRRSRWISNTTLTDTLMGLDAKHVMVVADSCFSGTLVRGADLVVRKRSGDYWKRMAAKRTRVAITSGGLEPVADKGGGSHSPFAKAFIDTLRENTAVMDGTTLFSKMRRPVMIAAEQTPQYADVRQAGHDGGDFLFVRRK